MLERDVLIAGAPSRRIFGILVIGGVLILALTTGFQTLASLLYLAAPVGILSALTLAIGYGVSFLLRKSGIRFASVVAALYWLELAALFCFVVPAFTQVYREMNVPLPLRTQWLMWPRWVWTLPCLGLAAGSIWKDRLPLPRWINPVLFALAAIVLALILHGSMPGYISMSTLVQK